MIYLLIVVFAALVFAAGKGQTVPPLPAYLPIIERNDPPPTNTPLPTPTLTPTPIPTNTLAILGTNTFVPFDGSNVVLVVGEVINNTSTHARNAVIDAVLRDVNGRLVDGGRSYVIIDLLPPGMKSPFVVVFDFAPAFSTYELAASWNTDTQAAYSLTVLEYEHFFDNPDAFHVRGEVRNQTGSQRVDVAVILTMYDHAGAVIGADSSHVQQFIAPNFSAPFEVDVSVWKGRPDREQVGSYSVVAIGE